MPSTPPPVGEPVVPPSSTHVEKETMMRFRIPLLILTSMALAPVSPALAAPADIVRDPDVLLSVCNVGVEQCVARVVGDLNGDRIDDLVFERMTIEELVNGRPTEGLSRQFAVVLGPYRAAAPGAPATRPAATITLEASQLRAPLSLADVNRDGMADLVFATSQLAGQFEAQRVSVVLGRKSWPTQIDLGRATGGDISVERRNPIKGEMAFFSPGTSINPVFADVNGDGGLDLVLGMDLILPGEFAQQALQVPPGAAASQVSVMFGDGAWAGKVAFRDDALMRDLGVCFRGLAGVADVSGDGVADIVARHCEGNGLPDRLEVLAGGADLRLRTETSGAEPATDPSAIVERLLDLSGALDGGDVPPPDPGRGYLPSGEQPSPFKPAPFFLEDVNADDVRDIVLGFGENTHIWLGGPDVAERVAGHRTDRVYIKAGFGQMTMTQNWRPADLNGDGGQDLLLTGPTSSMLAGCQLVGSANRCTPSAADPSRPGGGQAAGAIGPTSLRFYQRDWAATDVLDVETDAPQAVWETKVFAPWAMGDFNGDGKTDLLLGDPVVGLSAARNARSAGGIGGAMGIAFGPF